MDQSHNNIKEQSLVVLVGNEYNLYGGVVIIGYEIFRLYNLASIAYTIPILTVNFSIELNILFTGTLCLSIGLGSCVCILPGVSTVSGGSNITFLSTRVRHREGDAICAQFKYGLYSDNFTLLIGL